MARRRPRKGYAAAGGQTASQAPGTVHEVHLRPPSTGPRTMLTLSLTLPTATPKGGGVAVSIGVAAMAVFGSVGSYVCSGW
jgi:hypothetical protein